MSIDVENFILAAGDDPATWVTTPRWIGSVRFTAGFLRGQAFQVGYDPIEESEDTAANPHHGEVWGTFTRDQKEAMRNAAEWFVPIDGVEVA